MANKSLKWLVKLDESKKKSDVSTPTSARGRLKAIQCAKRAQLMSFPGARRLVCRKRLTKATKFLESQGANEKELCICLYVSGSELPGKLPYMTKDDSVTCSPESGLLAEYLLDDHPIRVQVMKYDVTIDSLAPPANETGRWKRRKLNPKRKINEMANKSLTWLVELDESKKKSDASTPTSARSHLKAIQCAKRAQLMSFPGARRLVCRKRLTEATKFLESQGANEKELCMCLYVSGSELPGKLPYMTKDDSVTCSPESGLLAEYLLNDHPIRVQVMKYDVTIDSFAPPSNETGRWKRRKLNPKKAES